MLHFSSANHKNKPRLTDIVIFKFLKPTDTSKYLQVGFKDG